MLRTSPPLTEVSRALRARNAEKVSNMSEAPGPRKVSKKSREQSEKTLSTLSGVFSGCSRDFFETFRGSGAGGPGRHVRDFFGVSGPKGPRDLCKGRARSQRSCRRLSPGSSTRCCNCNIKYLWGRPLL